MPKFLIFVQSRLRRLSRALYSLTVQAVTQVVSVTIPAGKVTDISGNENLASNQLDIKHCMNISFPSLFFFLTIICY